MRAQAVVVRSVEEGAHLEEIEVDGPGPGEVLVRVAASGICGSDLHLLHGTSVIDSFPMVLGHEGAGVVEAIGDGVTSVAARRPRRARALRPVRRVRACARQTRAVRRHRA